MGKKKDSPG